MPMWQPSERADAEALRAASDPRTPPAVLAELAGRHPDLHARIASNPAAYDDLVEWLRGSGDPDVAAAIAARSAQQAPVEAQPAPVEAQPAPAAGPAASGRAPWLLAGLGIGVVVGGAVSAAMLLWVLPGLFGFAL